MNGEKLYNGIVSKLPIEKGWSGDKKYLITTSNGNKYLLRITDDAKNEKCRKMFDMQKRLATLGIRMCEAIEIGRCSEGVYTIQTWIDGDDAEKVIPDLNEKEQYRLGLDAGRMLKRIHTVPAPEDQPLWEPRFNAKINRKLKAYSDCPVKFDGDVAIMRYIEENRHLLANRPQCYQHGDYHIGNMMVSCGELYIIDFDRYDFGDPWEEFNRIVWCAQSAPIFASGMVNGYFDGAPPIEFWRLLALYICSNTLSSIPWAIPFGEGEISTMVNQAKEVLSWYNMMQTQVPSWYVTRLSIND